MAGRRINVLELRSVRGTGGGPEKTILLGAAQADTSRFHIVVCYVRDRRDSVFQLGERARQLGVDYVEVDERHSFDPGILARLTALVRSRSIDLVHAHEYKTDLLAWLLARRTGIARLATAHGWTGQSTRERRFYYPVDKWVLARYPRVVAVSTDIKEELLRFGARSDRVTVILNAIDPALFQRDRSKTSAIRQALGLANDEIVIGAVGRVEQQKRFDLLLEALAPLFAARPRMRLALVGAGSLEEGLRDQAARLGLAARCLWLGHRQDIADLHHAFDLFVQSSEYEGTPNAVLEAMAMETPLVATDVGGTRELALPDVHGIIVPARNVDALRAGITRALDDPAAARLRAETARRRVESELSFAGRTRRLERLYEELVDA